MFIEFAHKGQSATVSTAGGELVSYRDAKGTEYIWEGDSAAWAGRNPILFPIVSSIINGKINIDGKPYEMKKHGFARHCSYTVAEQGAGYVVMELCANETTLAQYPFQFSLRVKYELLDNGVATTFTVKNNDEKPMPFCLGAHPGFRCPLHAGEAFEDYHLVFDAVEDIPKVVFDGDGIAIPVAGTGALADGKTIPLQHRVFDAIDTIIFERVNTPAVSLLHKDTRAGLRMEFAGLPILAFWTAPGKNANYICIEPWMGTFSTPEESGELKDKKHAVTLQPGEEYNLFYRVTTVA